MNLMLRRVLSLILITLFILTASGCWNRRELNALGILGTIAVDLEGDRIRLTLEVIKPKPIKGGNSGGAEEPVKFVQSTGDSIFDALRNATLTFDRKIFLPHTKVYIFSEEAAKKGIIDFMDFWHRDHESRRTTFLLVAKGSSAADVVGTAGGIENVPADYIERLIDAQRANSKAVTTRIVDFLRIYYDKGIQPTVGVIQKREKKKFGTLKKEGKEFELSDEGAAVFLNEKLVGFLDGIEARAYNFITGKVKSGIIVSETPGGKGKNSIEILKGRVKNDVEISGRNIKVSVAISITGMLGEETGKINLREPRVVEKVEEATSRVVRQEVECVIRKVQREYGSDIFGFGQVLHRKYPGEWKNMKDNWEELFSKAEVDVTVKTKITRTGLVNMPIKKTEGK